MSFAGSSASSVHDLQKADKLSFEKIPAYLGIWLLLNDCFVMLKQGLYREIFLPSSPYAKDKFDLFTKAV